MDRYKRSLEYLERAKLVTPGAAQTLSKSYKRFPEGAFPVAVRYGNGAMLMDLDQHWYVDWICGLGAITLGHRHNAVTLALMDQVDKGAIYSLPHELEMQVAERLCQKIPCADMVRFVSTGSEAAEAAIRTARIATGRDAIVTVKNGYHSWHSWFQAVKDWHPGVPYDYECMVRGITYNNFNLESEINFKRVAAVMLEPTLFEPPAEGWLAYLRELCTRHGVVLIFDEVVCGGRWALAGGQEYFGVTPDLATYGKGLANGLPFGFLCGKREYMQHAELISGTFGGNALSLAACNAVLDVYEQEPVIATMWKRGKELQDHFNAEAKNAGIADYAKADGFSCKPRFVINTPGHPLLGMSLFLQVAAENGALFHGSGFNVCAALTGEDMDVSKNAVSCGLALVANSLKQGDWKNLKGKVIKPVVTVRQS